MEVSGGGGTKRGAHVTVNGNGGGGPSRLAAWFRCLGISGEFCCVT